MAADWNFFSNLAGSGLGLAASTLGGPLGAMGASLIPGLFQGLGEGFGLTDSSSGIPGQVQQATNQAMDDMAKAQQIASYTASGMEGPYANREAFMKSRELLGTQSAESMLQQQMQRGLGTQALGAAQQQTDMAKAAADRALGAQSRGFMEQAAAAGASPAALAAGMANLGASNVGTLANLQQQGMQAQQQGLAQAGQAFAAADQSRLADQAARQQQFQNFALQKFGGSGAGALGSLLGGQAGMATTQQQIAAAEDPLALLKAVGGQVSSGGLGALNLSQMAGILGETGMTGGTGKAQGNATSDQMNILKILGLFKP